jgi:hypothetical protein
VRRTRRSRRAAAAPAEYASSTLAPQASLSCNLVYKQPVQVKNFDPALQPDFSMYIGSPHVQIEVSVRTCPARDYLIEDRAQAAAEHASNSSGRLRPTAAGDNSGPASQAGRLAMAGREGDFRALAHCRPDISIGGGGRRAAVGISALDRPPRSFAEPRPDGVF